MQRFYCRLYPVYLKNINKTGLVFIKLRLLKNKEKDYRPLVQRHTNHNTKLFCDTLSQRNTLS